MNILWTKTAVEDLKNIKEFIARDSEFYAIQFTGKIISSVEKFPYCRRWEGKFLKQTATMSEK